MMIYGIGIDQIEVKRVERSIKNQHFLKKIFTEDEIEYCNKFKYKEEHFAVRFAAKEAFVKALGTGLTGKMSFNEIGIRNNELGKPEIIVSGEVEKFLKNKIKEIHVSLTHTKDYATAIVILGK